MSSGEARAATYTELSDGVTGGCGRPFWLNNKSPQAPPTGQADVCRACTLASSTRRHLQGDSCARLHGLLIPATASPAMVSASGSSAGPFTFQPPLGVAKLQGAHGVCPNYHLQVGLVIAQPKDPPKVGVAPIQRRLIVSTIPTYPGASRYFRAACFTTLTREVP